MILYYLRENNLTINKKPNFKINVWQKNQRMAKKSTRFVILFLQDLSKLNESKDS